MSAKRWIINRCTDFPVGLFDAAEPGFLVVELGLDLTKDCVVDLVLVTSADDYGAFSGEQGQAQFSGLLVAAQRGRS